MKLNRTGSIWNRDNRNGINTNWDRLEGIMKSIDDLVVKGKLSNSEYSQLIKELNGLIKRGEISIYDIDKNKGLIDQSFLTPELLAQIAGTAPILSEVANGSITSSKVANRAIEPRHTTFFNVPGANLFSGSYTNGWLAQTNSGDNVILRMAANGVTIGKVAVIPVQGNTKYTYRIGNEADVTRVGVINKEPDFTSQDSVKKYHVDETIVVNGITREKTITTNSNAKYLLINVSLQGVESELLVVKGERIADSNVTPTIPKEYLDIGNSLHTLKFESGTVYSSGNIVKPNYPSVILTESVTLSSGFSIGLHDESTYWITVVGWDIENNSYNGLVGSSPGVVNIGYSGDFQIIVRRNDEKIIFKEELPLIERLIYIERGSGSNSGSVSNFTFTGGTVYTQGNIVKRDSGNSMILQNPITVEQGKYIGISDSTAFDLTIVHWDESGNYRSMAHDGTFTTEIKAPITGKYQLIMRTKDREDFTTADLNKASQVAYVSDTSLKGNQSGGTSMNYEYYLTDDVDHDFEMLFEPTYGGNDKNASVQYEKVINDIDTNIVSGNTDYVSKHSYGTSGRGETLYYYRYKPYMGDADSGSTGVLATQPKMPKLLLITGMHGNEKSPVFGTYAFLRMVTKNHKDNKLFDFIRRNIEIIHIPVANPDGFNDNKRQTSEGIDPNTDFGTSLWYHQATGSSKNHPDGPWSQPEIRALRDFVNSEKNITFALDYHNMFFRDEYIAYATANEEELQKVTLRGMMKGARELQIKHSYMPQNPNHKFVYIQTSGRGVSTRWFYEQGIPAITLETIRSNEWTPAPHYDFEDSTIEISATVLAEVLKAHIKMWK